MLLTSKFALSLLQSLLKSKTGLKTKNIAIWPHYEENNQTVFASFNLEKNSLG